MILGNCDGSSQIVLIFDHRAQVFRPINSAFLRTSDVRYPQLDYLETKAMVYENKNTSDNSRENSLAMCCDDMIEELMLPQDTLDYKHIPNHKVRSFYKTVVKRVLDTTCDVVTTRIDPISGTDSMDTPLEIKQQAQPAVTAFYDSLHLTEKARGAGI